MLIYLKQDESLPYVDPKQLQLTIFLFPTDRFQQKSIHINYGCRETNSILFY